MRRWFALGILATALSSYPQGVPKIIVEPPDSYVSEFGRIEFMGGCKLTEEEAICWNGLGAPSPSLAAKVTEDYRKGRLTQSLSYGKKQRFLYFSLPHGEGFQVSMNGDTEWPNTPFGVPKVERLVHRATITTAKEVNTAEVSVEIRGQVPPGKVTRLVMGSKFNFDGVQFEVAEISRNSNPFDPSTPRGWSVTLKTHGHALRSQEVTWSLLDRDKLPISAVDAAGRPVLGPSPNTGFTHVEPAGAKLAQPYFQAESWTENEMRISTNVDPKWIAFIRPSGSWQRNVLFAHLPLEPK